MAELWRLITDPPADGHWNMAVDEALLRSAQTGSSCPTLRFYGWNRPTLSIGYNQKTDKNFNIAFIESRGVPIVHRPTGGRAILHGDEVTYSVVIPMSSRYFGPLKIIYQMAQSAIVSALETIGILIDPRMSESGISRSPCCFVTKAGHEISIDGRKIAGSAQRRLRRAALQHGSIVLTQDRERYLSCFDWPDDNARSKAKALLGGVNDGRENPVTPGRLQEALIASFTSLYDINIVRGELTQTEARLVESIQGEAHQVLIG